MDLSIKSYLETQSSVSSQERILKNSFYSKESNIHKIYNVNSDFSIEKIEYDSSSALIQNSHSSIIDRPEFYMGFETQVGKNKIMFSDCTSTSLIITDKFNKIFMIPFDSFSPQLLYEFYEIISSILASKLNDSIFIGTHREEIVKVSFSMKGRTEIPVVTANLITNSLQFNESRIDQLKLHDNDTFIIASTAYNVVFYIKIELRERHLLSEDDKLICIESFNSQLFLIYEGGILKVYKSKESRLQSLFEIQLSIFSVFAQCSIFQFGQRVYILASSNKKFAVFNFDSTTYENRGMRINHLKPNGKIKFKSNIVKKAMICESKISILDAEGNLSLYRITEGNKFILSTLTVPSKRLDHKIIIDDFHVNPDEIIVVTPDKQIIPIIIQ